jgi:signal transduction histidine kinase
MIGIEKEKDTKIDVIHDYERATRLFLSEIQNARSEVLIAVGSNSYLEHLARIGFIDALARAKNKGANIMLLYPVSDIAKSEKSDKLFSQIKKYAQLGNVAEIKGTILIVDGSTVLVISSKGKSEFAIYSNYKSIVDNFVSFFDSFWNQQEMLASLIEAQANLLKSNRQLESANKQLEITNETQKAFINIAAHELRTPVQPILGMVDLLESRFDEAKETAEISKEDLKLIIRNAKRLQKLSSDILSVTRIESASLHLQKEEFDLSDLISEAVDDCSRTLSDKKVRLHYVLSNITVMADREAIAEVISNLVDNAIKFTEQGMISISESTQNNGREAVVAIKDTGIGIDPEIMPRLFEKFASKSERGTGLGLFISKSIIEAHGGRIWAENNKAGHGATFSFMLPEAKVSSK